MSTRIPMRHRIVEHSPLYSVRVLIVVGLRPSVGYYHSAFRAHSRAHSVNRGTLNRGTQYLSPQHRHVHFISTTVDRAPASCGVENPSKSQIIEVNMASISAVHLHELSYSLSTIITFSSLPLKISHVPAMFRPCFGGPSQEQARG